MIFKDTRTNENNGNTNYTTDNLSNATIVSNIPNGVGSFLSTDIYPGHKEVLGLSVTGSGSVNSKSYFQFKYKVSENGLGNNVKISVYKSNNPIEITENHFNCVKKNEKIENTNDTKYFETCEEKDLGFLIEEITLNGVEEEIVIGKDTITIKKENEDITKYYYVVVEFVNKDSSQNEDMNRKLVGKVNVELIAPFETDYANNIEGIATTKNESYAEQETFSIHVTSEKYRLVSMSEDNESWEDLPEKSKDITIEKTVTENGTYNYYFQDEAENIQEVTMEATKVDKNPPVANMKVIQDGKKITIDASSSYDDVSGIKTYYYSKDGINFESSDKSSYETSEYIYGTGTNTLINSKSNPLKKVYVKVEDYVGLMSDIKEYSLATTQSELIYDGTSDDNLRFIGKNPNNYVRFNNELWRVIGVMNNMKTNSADVGESRLKIVRVTSYGKLKWNSGSGWRLETWLTSNVKNVLNSTFLNNIDEISKLMVAQSVWKVEGVIDTTNSSCSSLEIYNVDKSGNEWIGAIALAYESDRILATSGGSYGYNNCRDGLMCVGRKNSECIGNSWLNTSNYPNGYLLSRSSNGNEAPRFSFAGTIASGTDDVYPTLYLKSNVKITGGLGTSSSPFTLAID